MILSDKEILYYLEQGMVTPYEKCQVKETNTPIISYGLSSFGYDVRLGTTFKVFSNVYNAIVDPKDWSPDTFEVFDGLDHLVIPPNSFALGVSIEYIKMPCSVIAICIGKSTYARCGIIVNVTPLEPGWNGYITIEISNTTPLPAKVYAKEGIAQLLFFKGKEPHTTYAGRAGKYHNSDTPTPVPPIM